MKKLTVVVAMTIALALSGCAALKGACNTLAGGSVIGQFCQEIPEEEVQPEVDAAE